MAKKAKNPPIISQPKSYGLIQTVTEPAHTVTNTWETDRNVLDKKRNHNLADTATFSGYDLKQ